MSEDAVQKKPEMLFAPGERAKRPRLDYDPARRNFVKMLAYVPIALMAAEMFDLQVLDGTITGGLIKAKNDPEYRKRLLQTIQEGRLDDKLKQAWEEVNVPYEPRCSLGEKANYREEDLDRGFVDYEIRPFVIGGEKTDNLVMVATCGDNMDVFVTLKGEEDLNSLSRTMEVEGSCFTMPSSLTKKRDNQSHTIDTYSSYKIREKVVTFAGHMVDYASGAVVVTNDSRLRVVDRSEVLDYKVGANCRAIQSYVVAVDSDKMDQDLDSLHSTSYNSGGTAAMARVNTSFIATLSDFDRKREETVVISIYQHYDKGTGSVSGKEWTLGISMEQAVGICEQLALEREYDRFMMVGPDPGRMHSNLNGPVLNDTKSGERAVRQFDLKDGPLMPVKNEDVFNPPVFIGARLR